MNRHQIQQLKKENSEESRRRYSTWVYTAFQLLHSISVFARQLLKALCTEGDVRLCERTGVNHCLLLDGMQLSEKTERRFILFAVL